MNRYPAIVVASYNRPKSLSRILSYISNAKYSIKEIPLVISIDGGGSDEVSQIANSFIWEYGDKTIITHDHNLGLRNHIISCGDLTESFGSIIMLEDDLIVSPYFYQYALAAINYYRNDERIAGISLYSYKTIPFANHMPFTPVDNGYDIYFMQVPSSWGQIWTREYWKSFKTFYNTEPCLNRDDRLPDSVKKWPESSWLKYYFKYIVLCNKFFVFPYKSFSSNWGDKGTHFSSSITNTRTTLAASFCDSFRFVDLDSSSVLYDSYMDLYPYCFKSFGDKLVEDFVNDLSGLKQIELFSDKPILTTKKCTFAEKTFGIELFPIEFNVLDEIPGNDIKFTKPEYVIDINRNTKKKLCQLYCPDSYQFGFSDGYSLAKSSASFRVGNLLIHPLSNIKILFNYVKKCLQKNN